MAKKVFYIEKEKFLRSMIEMALKSKSAEIYTVDSITDKFYLLDDLSPDLILVDLASVSALELEEILKKSAGKKIAFTGSPEDLEKNSSLEVSLKLEKPLVVNKISEKILSVLD